MLDDLFGNRSATRVLLHVFHYGEIHGAAIAKDYGMSLSPIQNQLERFERAGVLVSKMMGRTRVYSFNPKSPYTSHIRSILEIAYESIPLAERERIFGARRRPRAPGKRVLK